MTQAEDIAQIRKILEYFLREHMRERYGMKYKEGDEGSVKKHE